MLDLLGNPIFVVFGFLTITSVVSTLGYYWTKVRRAEMEASLKQTMLERGMSAEDIKKVIEAGASRAARREGDAEGSPEGAGSRQ